MSTAPLDPAAANLVAALEDDPFYRSISTGFEHHVSRRRDVLVHYFTYSIRESCAFGRCVRPPDPTLGVAAWLLPVSQEVRLRVKTDKRSFLEENLSASGAANYDRIIEFMSVQSSPLVPPDAWYLSIIAVSPAAQGRSLGQQLLAPTLAEADARGVSTYLETFTRRTLPFYQRLGFAVAGSFHEPTTNSGYHLLIRPPNTRASSL